MGNFIVYPEAQVAASPETREDARLLGRLADVYLKTPAERTIVIGDYLGYRGGRLMVALERAVFIHLYSSDAILDALCDSCAGMEGIKALLAPYCLEKNIDLEQAMLSVERQGGVEKIESEGIHVPVSTAFGAAVITLEKITAFEAINSWRLPKNAKNDFWRDEDEAFANVKRQILARLDNDELLKDIPAAAADELAYLMAEVVDWPHVFHPRASVPEIAAWLEAVKNGEKIDLGQRLWREKSPNLEKEIVFVRGKFLKAEALFALPEWLEIFRGLFNREAANPVSVDCWRQVAWNAIARIAWDIEGRCNSVVPEWPRPDILAKVAARPSAYKANFSDLGPNARRLILAEDFDFAKWPRVELNMSLRGFKFEGGRSFSVWWNCRLGKVEAEKNNVNLAEKVTEYLLKMD